MKKVFWLSIPALLLAGCTGEPDTPESSPAQIDTNGNPAADESIRP